jgi:phage tail sheath protein FI
MAQFLSSATSFEEVPPRQRAVPTFNTAVACFLGVTEKGPLPTAAPIIPQVVTSMTEFAKYFGGHIASSDMYAVLDSFFQNGGTIAYIGRVVHYTDVTDPTTKTSAAATLAALVDRAGSPLPTLLVGAKYDGTYANGLKIRIEAATSGNADEFKLTVETSAGVKLSGEIFDNLKIGTANAASSQYCVTVINHPVTGSNYIKVTDQLSVSVSPTNLPALGLSTALATGNDGLTSLADTDFTGSSAAKTGLYQFDLAEDATLLAVPGRATSAVHNGMVTYCSVARVGQIYPVLDPPAGSTAATLKTYVQTTAALAGLSEVGMMAWPRVKIVNPSKTIFGSSDNITVPMSGHVIGMISRNDNARVGGVYDAPAGTNRGVLFNVVDFETNETLDKAKRDIVELLPVNTLTTMTGFPRFMNNSRNLKKDGSWPFINQRRGVSFIERTIKLFMESFRQDPNTPLTRHEVERNLNAFLGTQCRLGAFASEDPNKAFVVDVSDALNPATTPNIMTIMVGLAMVTPAEFINVKFAADTRAFDAAVAGAK